MVVNKKHIKVMEIINELNKRGMQGEGGIFDCGELGVVHLWFHNSWAWEWIEISTEFKE